MANISAPLKILYKNMLQKNIFISTEQENINIELVKVTIKHFASYNKRFNTYTLPLYLRANPLQHV